jgi:paraquat-inducible protein B
MVSKEASKTMIGAFVLGALALIIIALIIFGKGMFFREKMKFVLYFDGSVKGLQIGSPVMFRGVPIGQVTNIQLLVNTKDLSAIIPVYVEIDPQKVSIVPGDPEPISDYALLQRLVEKGFKAQLQMQSFVTGQLVINFDMFPDKPMRLLSMDKHYQEIPTVPNTLDELQKIDLGAIALKIENALDSFTRILTQRELQNSFALLEKTLVSINRMSTNLDKQIIPVTEDVRETLRSMRITSDNISKAMSEYKDLAAQNKNIGYDIHKTMQELQSLLRSLRSLADYLDRHPEAVIRGKTAPEGVLK